MSERYALYFTPPETDPLYQLAAHWLGYDIYQKDITGIKIDHQAALKPLQPYRDFNAGAAVYGFHATLKPPFRLNKKISFKQLKKILKQFSKLQRPVECSPLKLEQIGDFLALVPKQNCKKINQLAKDCVQTFDIFRSPLNDDELIKRRSGNLSDRQIELLTEWGYPFVLDEFRFHLTLTDRLTQDQLDVCKPILDEYFKPYSKRNLLLQQISLCYQASEHSPFVVLETWPLTGRK